MSDAFDLESLAYVEQANLTRLKSFYDAGYEDGYAHGRIHGLIEGRALGREKGFEMWEELGFYEGFALLWKTIYFQQGRTDDRAMNHIKHLQDLISQFPRVNPSSIDPSGDVDIPKLFRQIRSRYKALCSTLGVKPSFRASESSPARNPEEGADEDTAAPGKKSVWGLDKAPMQEDMNF